MRIIKNISIKGKHQKPLVTDLFYKETDLLKKVVVFCHGYKGFKDWGAWNLMGKAFANAGFFFIKFNFSHNGGTAENPIDFPDLEAFGNNNYTKELDDLECLLDWISTNTKFKNEINLDNISLMGHSRGGGIVLLKAHEDRRVKQVITLAAVSDFGSRSSTTGDLEKWRREGVKYVVNGRTKQQMPHYYQFYENFKDNESRLNIKKAVRNLSVPLLIIHGDDDCAIEVKEAHQIHSWKPNSDLKLIKNANHAFNVSHPWQKDEFSKELAEVTALSIDFLT